MVVALNGKNGKEYQIPSEIDYEAISDSKRKLESEWDNLIKNDLISIEEMPDDLRGSIWSKPYLKYWYRLLNPRQRIVFASLIKNVREYLKEVQINDKEYLEAVGTYLSFYVSNHITRNCRSTTWDRMYRNNCSCIS